MSEEEPLPFSLYDLVLCRHKPHPYWPATIGRCPQGPNTGQYHAYFPTRGGSKTHAFWCVFSNDHQAGYWIPVNRIAKYHPSYVDWIRLAEKDTFSDMQNSALETAERAFALHEDTDSTPPPPTPDLLAYWKNIEVRNDDEEFASDFENPHRKETPIEPPTPPPVKRKRGRPKGSGKGKKRNKIVGKTGVEKPMIKKGRKVAKMNADDPASLEKACSGKKLNSECKAPSTAEEIIPMSGISDGKKSPKIFSPDANKWSQLNAIDLDLPSGDLASISIPSQKTSETEEKLNDQVRSLTTKVEALQALCAELSDIIRKKDERIRQLERSAQGGVQFFPPPYCTKLTTPIPPPQANRSERMDTVMFNDLIARIHTKFQTYRLEIRQARSARSKLVSEQDTLRRRYSTCWKDAVESDQRAADCELLMVSLLDHLLRADVSIEQLRENQVGKLVIEVGKEFAESETPPLFCQAIIDSITDQVREYSGGDVKRINVFGTAQEAAVGVDDVERTEIGGSGSEAGETFCFRAFVEEKEEHNIVEEHLLDDGKDLKRWGCELMGAIVEDGDEER